MRKRTGIIVAFLCCALNMGADNPVYALLDRIDKGASKKFELVIQKTEEGNDFFELDQNKDKVVVRGNNYVSLATGINWYLKYYAGIHLTWNNMHAKLPSLLPVVQKKERHTTNMKYRYYLNYCTFSYSMAFWDWRRWEEEIDWMALHGINLPLDIVGTDVVWYHVLRKLGYSKEEINQFIAGPGFQAWWLMNNLEGWGGPNPDNWYRHSETLQKKIVKRMKEIGIHPVFPGYSGMVPHNAKEKVGLNVQNPGKWCSFTRPAFLQPTDQRFPEIARLYYQEQEKLFGKADFYSMDPFHEGGNTQGVDLNAAGKAIWRAMKSENPKAVWVMQAWQANPRREMIENIPLKDLLILYLDAETVPDWKDETSTHIYKNGYGDKQWLYCMLLNYGGNVGLYGRMDWLIDGYYQARKSSFGSTMEGVGLTMEGIENNPVMYELLCELPWRQNSFAKEDWIEDYIKARYGHADADISAAWKILGSTSYNCKVPRQGMVESIFCARPSRHVESVSSWAGSARYYDPDDLIQAAQLFAKAKERFAGNKNYNYDLADIMRQANAEKGWKLYQKMILALDNQDVDRFRQRSTAFLDLLLAQDSLLASHPEFNVTTWIEMARSLGQTEAEKDLYEWNARTQITVWGNRMAADEGGLHDYAHKEWAGILRDFYYKRWKIWIDSQIAGLMGRQVPKIDFYSVEEPWTRESKIVDHQ